jgi:hypothetical protein
MQMVLLTGRSIIEIGSLLFDKANKQLGNEKNWKFKQKKIL